MSDNNLIKESETTYLYLFPELTDEDVDMLKAYGLTFEGKNRGPSSNEDNWVVTGNRASLERYADKWLGYELHPDYLYEYEDFAGDIIKESLVEDFENVSKGSIIDWLADHEQAYEDATTFFEDLPLEDIAKEDIIGWIANHNQLYDDFKRFFDSANETLNESNIPSQETLDDCLQDYLGNAFGYNGVEDYVDTQYPYHAQEFKARVVDYLKQHKNESLEKRGSGEWYVGDNESGFIYYSQDKAIAAYNSLKNSGVVNPDEVVMYELED